LASSHFLPLNFYFDIITFKIKYSKGLKSTNNSSSGAMMSIRQKAKFPQLTSILKMGRYIIVSPCPSSQYGPPFIWCLPFNSCFLFVHRLFLTTLQGRHPEVESDRRYNKVSWSNCVVNPSVFLHYS
jgi:hypothetical protein